MLDPKSEASSKIDNIRQRVDDSLRLAALAIEELGGKDAVDDYLNHTVCNVIAIAIVANGQRNACELMAAGLITAEEYSEC